MEEKKRPDYPRVKFCGMTRKQDLLKAVKLGADFIGFIFHPNSPRYLPLSQAMSLIQGIDFKTTEKVGVFVNNSVGEILSTVSDLGLDVIQLHGDYDEKSISEMREQTPTTLWKTIRVKDDKSVESIRQSNFEHLLIDAYSADNYGGTGKRIDLDRVKAICGMQKLGGASPKKIIVAGGLNPENIGSLLECCPWGVDINSGVETSPGIKDHSRMEAIITTLTRSQLPENP